MKKKAVIKNLRDLLKLCQTKSYGIHKIGVEENGEKRSLADFQISLRDAATLALNAFKCGMGSGAMYGEAQLENLSSIDPDEYLEYCMDLYTNTTLLREVEHLTEMAELADKSSQDSE